MGVLGVLYIRLVVAGLDGFERLRAVSPELKAAAVGAIVGAFSWSSRRSPWVAASRRCRRCSTAATRSPLIATLFCVRLVLGPLCYAPGLPGGLFAPLLVVGAAGGLLLGVTAEVLLPPLTTPRAAFVAAGMGALFVAVVRAPVTGIALVVEMTGATSMFVPLLTACITAMAMPALLGARPIYDTLRDRDSR